jgi:hypothetical protein
MAAVLNETYSGPMVIYIIFMLALITFNITQYDKISVIRNSIFLVIGSTLLWLLARIGFEIAGWILISIIPFFFVALIALLVVTQIIKTDINYDDGTNKIISGKTLLAYFGYEDIESKKVVRPPGAGPFDVIADPDPSPCDSMKIEEPEIPKISPVKRIIGQLEHKQPPETCVQNTCTSQCY